MTGEYLLNAAKVSEKVCLSKAQIYAMVKAGAFPLPIPITKGASRWRGADVDSWIVEQASKPRVEARKSA